MSDKFVKYYFKIKNKNDLIYNFIKNEINKKTKIKLITNLIITKNTKRNSKNIFIVIMKIFYLFHE